MIERKIILGEPPKHPEPTEWWWFGKGLFGKLMWSIFGNSDDPEPIDEYYPNNWSDNKKRLHWYFIRNPLHNFTHYVIGAKHLTRTLYGFGVDRVLRNGWCMYIAYVHKRKVFLPFISYQKTTKDKVFQFYVGWRRGAMLGFKLRYIKRT